MARRVTALGHLSDAFHALVKARDAARRAGDDKIHDEAQGLVVDTARLLAATRAERRADGLSCGRYEV